MINARPKIGIILINFNSYNDTAVCLRSLAKMTYAPLQIYVVHNGCVDQSPEKLQAEFPNSTHIISEKNLGFSGGNNLGIAQALKNGAEHILLLNNDTYVTPEFLEPLVERLLSDVKIAAVSGKIYYAPEAKNGASDIIWYAGCFRKWHTGYHHFGVNEHDTGKFETARTVPFASGCLMLMRGALLKSQGFLSEDYFLYWEEADWCQTAFANGYVCYYEPRSVIFHNFRSAHLGEETPLYMYLQTRNAFIYSKRHYKGLLRLRFWLFYPIYLLNRYRFEVQAKNYKSARAMLWGLSDYRKGFTGTAGLAERGFLR
jgi:GT2 family glycosyltransferase